MADNPLLQALLGVNVTPQETLFGQGAQTMGTLMPNVYSPYVSPGRNLASIAGAGLLAGLMGYAAKREAEAENRALAPQLSSILSAQTPEELSTLAGAEGFSSRLMPLAQQMMLSQYTSRQDAAAKRAAQLAELEGKATFELGPLGTALSERDLQQQLKLIDARNAALKSLGGASEKPKPSAWDKIPASAKTQFAMAEGTFKELRSLADQFENLNLTAAEYQVARRVPGSASDLAYSKALTLVPTAARLMGEVGNLNEFEQQRQIQSTLGSALSGSESIAKRLRQLANTAEEMTNNRRAYYEKQAALSSGPLLFENVVQENPETMEALAQQMGVDGQQQDPEDAAKLLEEQLLQQKLAALKARAARKAAGGQ